MTYEKSLAARFKKRLMAGFTKRFERRYLWKDYAANMKRLTAQTHKKWRRDLKKLAAQLKKNFIGSTYEKILAAKFRKNWQRYFRKIDRATYKKTDGGFYEKILASQLMKRLDCGANMKILTAQL